MVLGHCNYSSPSIHPPMPHPLDPLSSPIYIQVCGVSRFHLNLFWPECVSQPSFTVICARRSHQHGSTSQGFRGCRAWMAAATRAFSLALAPALSWAYRRARLGDKHPSRALVQQVQPTNTRLSKKSLGRLNQLGLRPRPGSVSVGAGGRESRDGRDAPPGEARRCRG